MPLFLSVKELKVRESRKSKKMQGSYGFRSCSRALRICVSVYAPQISTTTTTMLTAILSAAKSGCGICYSTSFVWFVNREQRLANGSHPS
jgi:hypothetical protein